MTLAGSPISQLPPQAGDIRTDDRFFTSERLVPDAPFAEYVSRSTQYGDLVEQLFQDLSAAFGFRSMSHELSQDYSLVDHTHGCNKFEISSMYEPSRGETVTLATFKTDYRTVRLCMPRPWMYKQPDPEIGELQFRLLPHPPAEDIDISASDFDGWVYPDGKAYYAPKGEFEDAKAYFQSTTDMFTVPSLNDFIRLDCMGRATRHVERSSGVPAHSHSAKVQLNGKTTTTLHIDVSEDAGDGGKIHVGADQGGSSDRPYRNMLALDGYDVEVTEDAQIGNSDDEYDVETHPPYNYVPAMIYIGKRKRA